MATMCVTKPLRIERRYKRGCSMRYSIYGGKQKEAYMQNVMYSTFVSKEWLPDLLFTFKDGNQYNFKLANIEPERKRVNQVLIDNIEKFKWEYEKRKQLILLRYDTRRTEREDGAACERACAQRVGACQ
jgi:hypothetical protein